MGEFYEKDMAHQSAAAHRLLRAVCVFLRERRCYFGDDAVLRRDDRQLCDFVPLRAENRQRSDHFYRKYTELYFFLFDGKADEIGPDGMVLQAVYIPLPDRRDIGRVPHHPCDHRMEKRQKAEERTGV